ncbi:hypothetical protein BH09ACT7_BH09ACT7_17950 [soil metagenome]
MCGYAGGTETTVVVGAPTSCPIASITMSAISSDDDVVAGAGVGAGSSAKAGAATHIERPSSAAAIQRADCLPGMPIKLAPGSYRRSAVIGTTVRILIE